MQMGAQITWREPDSFSQARSGPNSRRDLAAEPAHDDPGLQVADTPSASSVLHLCRPLWLVVKNVQAIASHWQWQRESKSQPQMYRIHHTG
jgi:hypothetical protein